MNEVKEEEFSYKTCPVYLIEFDLEEAKGNLRFDKQNLKNINEQLTTAMSQLQGYEMTHDLAKLDVYQQGVYRRIRSYAEDLVTTKLRVKQAIKYEKSQIKKLKAILKGRGVA